MPFMDISCFVWLVWNSIEIRVKLYCTMQYVQHRLEMTSFSHDGIFGQALWGWGAMPHCPPPFLLYLPRFFELQCPLSSPSHKDYGDIQLPVLKSIAPLPLSWYPEAESKEKHGVWDPMPELTIPYLISTTESTPTHLPLATLCQSRPSPYARVDFTVSPSQGLKIWTLFCMYWCIHGGNSELEETHLFLSRCIRLLLSLTLLISYSFFSLCSWCSPFLHIVCFPLIFSTQSNVLSTEETCTVRMKLKTF
jgi:hypothetical protein